MCRSSSSWCVRGAFHLVDDPCLCVLPAMLLHIVCSTYKRLVTLLLFTMIPNIVACSHHVAGYIVILTILRNVL